MIWARNGNNSEDEEQKKRMKRRLINRAKSHFEKGIVFLLESVDKNSVDYVKVLLFFKKNPHKNGKERHVLHKSYEERKNQNIQRILLLQRT